MRHGQFSDSIPFLYHASTNCLSFFMQVSSALFWLRERNTYQGNIPHVLLKPGANIDEPACHSSSFDSSTDDTQESGSHVVEIVESSRTKAQTMVDAAMQV
jgi:hypothetical protein